MEIVTDVIGTLMFIFLAVFMYINLHVEEEKVAKERIPLMWEEGGWLNKLWKMAKEK